jgi:ACR3 family arsenite transporter
MSASTPPVSESFNTPPPIQDPDLEKNISSPASDDCEPEGNVPVFKGLGWLDRFLAVWIFLAMAIGIILGNFVPSTGPALQKGEFVGVSVPISELYTKRVICHLLTLRTSAIGLLVMMYPILCKVQFETLHHVLRKRDIWVQIFFSVVMNWIVAPLLMVLMLLFLFLLTTTTNPESARSCMGISSRQARTSRRLNHGRPSSLYRDGKVSWP